MKPFAWLTAVLHLVLILIVLPLCFATAHASTTKHFARLTQAKSAWRTASSADGGISSVSGAFVEAEYAVSSGHVATERARTDALREANQGRYAFDEAIAYLKESPRAANVIRRIEKADGMLLVIINHECRDGQSIGLGWKSIVEWDPACAYRVANGTNSPSVILLHELVHTLHLFEDPEAFLNYGSKKNTQFDDDEERRTILYGENPVERQLGEFVRVNHIDGRPFPVNDPTIR